MPGIVASRHRLVTEDGSIKCDREAAQSLVHGLKGRMVEHSTVVLLRGGGEVLGPWVACDCPGPTVDADVPLLGRGCSNCGHQRGRHRVSSGPSECLFEYTGERASIARCRCPKFEKE